MANRNIPPEIKEAYLDWLLQPPGRREPTTKKDFAEVNGIAQKTLYNWEEEEEFQAQLNRIKITWGNKLHPDLLGELYRIAMESSSDNNRINAIRTLLSHLDVKTDDKETEVNDEAAKAIMKFLEDNGFKTIATK